MFLFCFGVLSTNELYCDAKGDFNGDFDDKTLVVRLVALHVLGPVLAALALELVRLERLDQRQ